jgi:CBS domain-containing protein
MKIGEFCNRQVVIANGNDSLKSIAELMRTHHVGDVVLVEEKEGKRIPTGIITDRDLVLEVIAAGLDSEKLFARDLIISPLSSIEKIKTYSMHWI